MGRHRADDQMAGVGFLSITVNGSVTKATTVEVAEAATRSGRKSLKAGAAESSTGSRAYAADGESLRRIIGLSVGGARKSRHRGRPRKDRTRLLQCLPRQGFAP